MEQMSELFQVHMLNETGKKNAALIAEAFNTCLCALRSVCKTDSREFAIALTKLEEACFFAKKSISKHTQSQAA
jgi:hypothetical protein